MARRQTSDMSKEIAEKMVNPTSSPLEVTCLDNI